MGLMEQFSDPELMHSLSFVEKMEGAGITTLMGMGTTFLILILLWGIIASTTKLISIADQKRTAHAAAGAGASAASEPAAATPAAATVAPVASGVEATPSGGADVGTSDDEALVAVISAAIAAYEDGETTPDMIVKRIRRVSGPSTVWANAGRNESVDSRRM